MSALSPWQGQRMKDFRNYTRPFEIGELIDGDALGVVIASEDPDVEIGARVTGRLGWQEYAVCDTAGLDRADARFPDSHWLTALSSPGLTAYSAFDICARPMPGQTWVVTSGAGAVGGYAVQLGKLAGMRVIAIAGSASKCAYASDTLGADRALCYRVPDFSEQLRAATPEGVHLCFDTVGGSIADTVFDNLAKYASVIIVGRTASNTSDSPGDDPVNMRQLWAREAKVLPYSRYSHDERFAFAKERMMALLAEDKLVTTDTIVDGFESAPDALRRMLSGEFIGKVLVRFAPDEENR
ncbi:MAG: NADP-dependent oxidoreductase [Pseudomonadota bacterium]